MGRPTRRRGPCRPRLRPQMRREEVRLLLAVVCIIIIVDALPAAVVYPLVDELRSIEFHTYLKDQYVYGGDTEHRMLDGNCVLY